MLPNTGECLYLEKGTNKANKSNRCTLLGPRRGYLSPHRCLKSHFSCQCWKRCLTICGEQVLYHYFCSSHRLGGPDPLDYISMYANQGDESREIPPHWHYVSFGLSDLHGDGRVHEYVSLDIERGLSASHRCPENTF